MNEQLIEAIKEAAEWAALRNITIFAWVEYGFACIHANRPDGIQSVQVSADGSFKLWEGRQPE